MVCKRQCPLPHAVLVTPGKGEMGFTAKLAKSASQTRRSTTRSLMKEQLGAHTTDLRGHLDRYT